MAGTTSANPAGYSAPRSALSWVAPRAANLFSQLEIWLTYRSLALTGAGLLGLIGLAAPSLNATTLSALLIVSSLGLLGLFVCAELGASTAVKWPAPGAAIVSAVTHSTVMPATGAAKIDIASLADCPWVTLTSRVSHELRTPLNAVLGFSEIMASEMFGPLGDQRYQEYASYIRKSGHVLLKSADDILAVTSLLAGTSTAAGSEGSNFSELVDDAIAFVAAEAAVRGIAIQNRVSSSTEITGDPRAHRQVLTNLVAEAVNRAGENGQIQIGTAVSGCTLRFEIAAEPASAERKSTTNRSGSLAMSLAETLTGLQGLLLTQRTSSSGTWYANIPFECATQSDFFLNSSSLGASPRTAELTA